MTCPPGCRQGFFGCYPDGTAFGVDCTTDVESPLPDEDPVFVGEGGVSNPQSDADCGAGFEYVGGVCQLIPSATPDPGVPGSGGHCNTGEMWDSTISGCVPDPSFATPVPGPSPDAGDGGSVDLPPDPLPDDIMTIDESGPPLSFPPTGAPPTVVGTTARTLLYAGGALALLYFLSRRKKRRRR